MHLPTLKALHETGQKLEQPMWKFLKRLCIVVVVLLLIAGVAGWFVHQSMQTGPEFYQQAMQADFRSYEDAGEQLEQKIFDLRDEVLKEDRWSATFTEEQINGWLAADLPRRFPNRLPKNVSDPRISITEEGMQLAFRYQDKRFSGIVTLQAHAFVSEEENEVGIVVKRLNAGVIPLPISKWTERISKSAASANVPLRWSQQDGNPVALVGVQVHLPDQPDRKLTIETIEFSEGKLHIAGTADAPVEVVDPVHGLALRRSNNSSVEKNEAVQR